VRTPEDGALQQLEAWRAFHRERQHGGWPGDERRAELTRAIRCARDSLFDEAFGEQDALDCAGVHAAVREYAARSDWSLLDLATLATCSDAPEDELAGRVAPHALAYQALRMLDDVLDDHTDYKGLGPTLLGELRQEPARAHLAVPGNLLPLTMMVVAASAALDDTDRRLMQQTLSGMLAEAVFDEWTVASYQTIAEAKMVSYGSFLYRPVLASFPQAVRDALYPFLKRSFYIGQILNDLHDRADDVRRGQPNLWTLAGEEAARAHLLDELDGLSAACQRLEPVVQSYGHARVADLIGYVIFLDRNSQVA
jgi:hypothetical protein